MLFNFPILQSPICAWMMVNRNVGRITHKVHGPLPGPEQALFLLALMRHAGHPQRTQTWEHTTPRPAGPGHTQTPSPTTDTRAGAQPREAPQRNGVGTQRLALAELGLVSFSWTAAKKMKLLCQFK